MTTKWLFQVGVEKVRISKLGQKDLVGSCLGRRVVGDSRLRRRELDASRPTVRYRDGYLLQCVRNIAQGLQTGTE